jgi:hypothetical protein
MAGSDQSSERVSSPLGVGFGHAYAHAANFHSCVKVVLRQGNANYSLLVFWYMLQSYSCKRKSDRFVVFVEKAFCMLQSVDVRTEC